MFSCTHAQPQAAWPGEHRRRKKSDACYKSGHADLMTAHKGCSYKHKIPNTTPSLAFIHADLNDSLPTHRMQLKDRYGKHTTCDRPSFCVTSLFMYKRCHPNPRLRSGRGSLSPSTCKTKGWGVHAHGSNMGSRTPGNPSNVGCKAPDQRALASRHYSTDLPLTHAQWKVALGLSY